MADRWDWNPHYWAKMAVYRALSKWNGSIINDQECAGQIGWAVQRLHWDLYGDIMPPAEDGEPTLHDRALYGMNPQQGADLEDMGEWAEWIINGLLPENRLMHP